MDSHEFSLICWQPGITEVLYNNTIHVILAVDYKEESVQIFDADGSFWVSISQIELV